MKGKWAFFAAAGLTLALSAPVSAQVTGGVLHVSNTHMSWWGGVARDATARLYDVDANAIRLDKKVGTITFKAKEGRLVDLDKLHESIWATRLGDRTGMELHVLDVTAKGTAMISGDNVLLKVPGSEQYFVLKENPKTQAKNGAKTPFQKLREAIQQGEQPVQVSGRLEGWQGNFTRFLSKLPGKPRSILVSEFEVSK